MIILNNIECVFISKSFFLNKNTVGLLDLLNTWSYHIAFHILEAY